MKLKKVHRLQHVFDYFAEPKKSKYNNTLTVVDGIKFHSKRESDYYAELLLEKKAKKILKIELQPVFLLQPGFRSKNFKRAINPINYKADFKVTYADGTVEVIEVKGFKTKDYSIKKKLFLYKYPEFIFREIC